MNRWQHVAAGRTAPESPQQRGSDGWSPGIGGKDIPMIRAAILAAALAVTGAGFSGPALAAGDDNDPHMRFPTERGWELKDWQRDDGAPKRGEEKSMEGAPGKPGMTRPEGRRERMPGGGQGPGAPGGRY